MGDVAPLGAILVSWGAIISKGAKGGEAILKFIQDILELQMKSKKKDEELHVYIKSFRATSKSIID